MLSNVTPPKSTPKADFLVETLALVFETREIVSVSGILMITGNTPGAFRLSILLEKFGVKLFSPEVSPLLALYSTTV